MTLAARLRAAGCVYAEDEAALIEAAATSPEHLETMARQRINGQPLETVLGWTDFLGRRITVEPGVFIPRRRTQHLAREAATRLHPPAVVVDLCCGSGAIATILARHDVELHAVDIDPVAVRCARRNLPAGHIYQGDLYQPLPARLRGRVNIIVANTPYVPTHAIPTMPPEARDHEPTTALDGGPDGLTTARRVVTDAPQWLAPGGAVLIETSTRQAPLLADVMSAHGLTPQITTNDDLDATAVIGTRNSDCEPRQS